MTQADQVGEWGGKRVQVREEEDEEMRERESPLGFSEPDLNARRIPGSGQEREREQRAGWVCWAGLWWAHPGACMEN